jgi:type VI secretion system protein ImpL
MSWQTDQLKYSLGLTGLVSFYGIVMLGVWFLGDRFSYDMSYRIVTIAIVLLTLPFALVGAYLVSRRGKKQAQAQEAAGQDAEAGAADATPQKLTTPAGNYDELTTSAEEVVQFLKNSNLGAGKDAVYALPWYLVIGTPKSGKTSLVLSSGLNFQNLPSQRQSEQRFIRPTRSVDWRVTSDAVFLDTAGRYQTEGADHEEWSSLLETVKKYRQQRPLDGMILTVSAERILHADEAEVEQMAKVLRARVDETMARTKTRFPVYLVFTHADAIEGFRDSFSTSQREGQALVWGATIPLEQSANAHALFDGEYDLLQTSVMKRRLIRLSAPFTPVRQLKIFNFPLHFGSARRKLGAFVASLFRPNPFSESPFLRGFYFTAVPVNRQSSRGGMGQTQVGAQQTVGQSYFSERLFRDVVLRDKDLVATFQAQKVRPPVMGWLLLFSGAFLTFLLLAFSAYSLYQNKQLLDKATTRGQALQVITRADKGRNPLDKKEEEASAEIEATENLREVLDELDKYEREGAPLSMRLGLYSGSRIYKEKLLDIYFNAIEHRFKNPTVERLQNDLRKFSASPAIAVSGQPTKEQEKELERHYELFKAYLMLSNEYRDKAEPSSLSNTLADYWKTESKIPSRQEQVSLEQLKFYARQIDRDRFPRIQLDKGLVEGVRKKLQVYPAVLRYYQRVTSDINKEVPSVSTENVLAGRSGGVLEGSHIVPGAYTLNGYRNYMKDAIAKAGNEIGKDDWVMGIKDEKAQAQGADIQRLQDKYFSDYTEQWRSFIRGVNVKPFKSKEDAANALKEFGRVDSPMAILVRRVKEETNLSAKQEEGWFAWIKSFIVSSDDTEMGGETVVDKAFKPLATFVGSEGGKEGGKDDAPLTKYNNHLKNLGDQLAKPEIQIKKISEDIANEKTPTWLSKPRDAVNALLENFNDETAAGPDLAALLRKPVDNLDALVGATELEQIRKTWMEAVLPKAKEAERGYPYDAAASGYADLTRITTYLNPVDGTLSKFFNDRLSKHFELVDGQYKVREGGQAQFTPEFVAYLNNAFKLRAALFGEKSPRPEFSYDFTLQKTDDTPIEVKIDGETIDSSSGTGSKTLKFPATSGESGVFLGLGSSDSTSTSSITPDADSQNGEIAKPSPSSSQSGAVSKKYPGVWGLFEFFDDGGGASKKQPTGEYLLTYKLGAKSVTISLKPSGSDLFNRSLFTARAPQNILK